MHNFSARSYWYMVLVGGLTLYECVRFEVKWRMERGREDGILDCKVGRVYCVD